MTQPLPPIVFSAAARQYAPWSISKANLAYGCPFGFQLAHVKKVKGTHRPANPAGRIGNAAHMVLEHVLAGRSPGTPLEVFFDQAASKYRLTSVEKEELLAHTNAVVSFQKRLAAFAEKSRIGPQDIFVEHRFGFDADLKPTKFFDKNVFFRGVWDLGLKMPANGGYAVGIINHKTGTPGSDNAYYNPQRTAYAISALVLFPEMTSVRTALHYLQTEELQWEEEHTTPAKIRDTLGPWLVNFLNTAGTMAQTNEAREGWQCAFCEYVNLCPKKAEA